MTANPVLRFLKGLIANYGRWRVTDETFDLYLEKLSGYRLSDDQWARALSRIVADHTDDNLPTLGVIYDYLDKAKQAAKTGEWIGWMTFRYKAKPHAVKVRAEAGSWVNAPCEVHDRNGDPVQLQANPGCTPHLPDEYECCQVIPDKPYSDDQPATPGEAIAAFKAGLEESGARPEAAAAIMELVASGKRNRIRKTGFVAVSDILLPRLPDDWKAPEPEPEEDEVPF